MSKFASDVRIYLPLKAFLAYVTLTLLLHYLGPWEYEDEKILLPVAYMIGVMLLFALGYTSVAKRKSQNLVRSESVCAENFRRFKFVAKVGLVLQLVLTVAGAIIDAGAGRLSIISLLNPGQVYIDALNYAKAGAESSFVGQLRIIASPLIYVSNAFLLFSFYKLGRVWRFGLVGTLLLQLIIGVMTKGAQKGIFDLFIIFACTSFLRVYFDAKRFHRWVRTSMILLVLVLLAFTFFQLSRLAAYNISEIGVIGKMRLDSEGLIFVIFGEKMGLAVAVFIGYISQGYYGLSLCLGLPFEWTYGIGNSFALTSYAEQYLGISQVEAATYPLRMEAAYGWPAKMLWQTFFPWVASDITFVGALLLMYPIGRLYARSLTESLTYENPLSICVFYFLTTLLLFLPANNQLMQTREMMVGSVVIILSWLFLGSRFRRPRIILYSPHPATIPDHFASPSVGDGLLKIEGK